MTPAFHQFIEKWRTVAYAGEIFRLPKRAEITIAAFQDFLPKMMIAAWDPEAKGSKVLYAGTKIDQAFQRDIRHSPMQAMFASDKHMAAHTEIAMAVIKDQIAAEVHADLLIDGDKEVTISQLRLPLEAEGGCPLIVSLFSMPELTEATGDATTLPVVRNFRHHFIELAPAAARIA